MLTIDLALAGVGIGGIAALAGLGLVVTYRVTGVFNLAFGAIAMLAAYVLRELVRVHGWPVLPSALVVVGGLCPAFGIALDRWVFRPLQRRQAAPVEAIVASLGVFTLLVGLAFTAWGGQARLDAPSLVATDVVHLLGGATIPLPSVLNVAIVAVGAAAFAITLRTRLGRQMRAAVDRRDLAELSGIDTDRVSTIAWATGSAIAGLSGVLLAPTLRLEPYGLTLVVLETMAVAVIARLASPVRAVVAALALGIGQSELTRVHFTGRMRSLHEALTANLFVVALLGALLVVRHLSAGDDRTTGRADPGAAARLSTRRYTPPPRWWWIPGLAVLAAPLTFAVDDVRTAQLVPALAIVLVSIVLVSGYGGQITLGQAGFAGLGALFTARAAAGSLFGLPRMTGVVALVVGVVAVVPIGVLTGWPAIRRRGLFLALTTFAVAAVVDKLVFAQPAFVRGVPVHMPAPFTSDRAFYAFELGCLGLVLLVVHLHHRGRLGRALIAIRDDEAGARASGVDVRRLKVFVFAVGAAVAALGGALLSERARAFDSATFDPIQGLIWFAAVVVFGLDSAAGAVLAAGVIVTLDAIARPGVSTIVVGALAVALGRLPGGLLVSARRAIAGARRPEPPAPAMGLSPAGRVIVTRLVHRSPTAPTGVRR